MLLATEVLETRNFWNQRPSGNLLDLPPYPKILAGPPFYPDSPLLYVSACRLGHLMVKRKVLSVLPNNGEAIQI